MLTRRVLVLVFACLTGVAPRLYAQVLALPQTLSALNQCAAISVTGQSTVGIQVKGTFSATLQPQVSVQGQTLTNTSVTPPGASTAQSTITGAGVFSAAVAGFDSFQLCISSYTSGSATVYLNATTSGSANLSGGSVTVNNSTTSPANVNVTNFSTPSTGNITANAQCVSISTLGAGGVSVQLVSSAFVGTIQFEFSIDGVTLNSSNTTPFMYPLPIGSGAAVFNTTAAGIWGGNSSGWNTFAACSTAFTSGSMAVTLVATQADVIPSGFVVPASTAAGSVNASLQVAQSPIGASGCTFPSNSNLTTISAQTSGTVLTQIVALSAGKHITICHVAITVGSGTSPTFELEYGTGTNCAAGTNPILPATPIPTGAWQDLGGPYSVPAGNALCYIVGGSSTPAGFYTITYAQQ